MTKERRNNGHAKKGNNHLQLFLLQLYLTYDPEEATAIRDISEMSIFNAYVLPNSIKDIIPHELCHSQQGGQVLILGGPGGLNPLP